jgi:hypothetical protein
VDSRLTFEGVTRDIEGYYGVRSSTIQKIGVFVIAWGMFESELELTVLALTEEILNSDKRPSTDTKQVSDLIMKIREKSVQFEEAICSISIAMCDAADGLLMIRNAIHHGWLIPSKLEGAGFINNPKWLNVTRKRDTTEVFLTDQLLEQFVEAVAIIRECSMRLRHFVGGFENYPAEYVTELSAIVDRAKTIASVDRSPLI